MIRCAVLVQAKSSLKFSKKYTESHKFGRKLIRYVDL